MVQPINVPIQNSAKIGIPATFEHPTVNETNNNKLVFSLVNSIRKC